MGTGSVTGQLSGGAGRVEAELQDKRLESYPGEAWTGDEKASFAVLRPSGSETSWPTDGGGGGRERGALSLTWSSLAVCFLLSPLAPLLP